MDDPGLDAASHHAALRGLARLNRLGGGTESTWEAISLFCQRRGLRALRVLDLACGGGDVPVELARRAGRAGLELSIDGCDLNGQALEHARQRASDAGARVHFFACDALRDPLPTGYDLVMSSLFLHHLTRAQAVLLLRRMAEVAGRMVLINDLARSRLNVGLVGLAARMVSTSPIVHADGPQSVRAAWSLAELRELCVEAELAGARVTAQFPCRMLMVWEKPS
jgi:SAM-dependent methyltransferase